MTRRSLRRTMRKIYLLLGIILLISLMSKVADHGGILSGTGLEKVLKDAYEFLRDMSLLIATGGVAYISNVYQRRHTFLENLNQEWREIINTKSTLLTYMHKLDPDHSDYIRAYTCLSETIDNMRTVYRNVGETKSEIGLYPFAPLHDMRRVLQTLNPKHGPFTDAQTRLARDAMLQSFYALRDSYLEELDLEEPDFPILVAGARRLRVPGAKRSARRAQSNEAKRQTRFRSSTDEIDVLLLGLYEAESARNDKPDVSGKLAEQPPIIVPTLESQRRS